MKRWSLILIIGLSFLLFSGCAKEGQVKELTQIVYITESGPILPELRMHEEYRIQTDGVLFIRSGAGEGSQVNSGEWVIDTDAAAIEALFESLNKVDPDKAIRVDSEEAADGAGRKIIALNYADGSSFSLDYTGDVTYENTEVISEPILLFIKSLDLPIDAVATIRE